MNRTILLMIAAILTVTAVAATGGAFTVTPTEGYAPLDVDYACSASFGIWPYSYSVSFGDGASTTDRAGSYTYHDDGDYELECIARDAIGRKQVYTETVTVKPTTPVTAKLIVDPMSGTAPLDVEYSCTASGGISPYSYSVSFGDGASTTDRAGSYTYHDGGDYDVTCIARDAIGRKATTTAKVSVDEPTPVKAKLIVDPTEGYAPLDVEYSCTASGGIAPYSYSIEFGDGASTTDASGSYVYHDDGSYALTCIARDAIGQKGTARTDIAVTSEPVDLKPSVSLSADPTWGYAPMDVRYACDVSGGDAPISTIVDFGDGASSSDPDSSHTYDTPGYYTMTCTATDVDGDTKTDSISLRVKELVDEQPSVDLDVTPTQGEAPLTVSYACAVEGGDAPLTSHVSFEGSSTNAMSGDITFENPGSYDIVCSAKDVDGDTDSDSVTVTVKEPIASLTAKLIVDPMSGTAPLDVEYSCTASGGIAPYSYSIEFGDGASTTDASGSYVYHEDGSYWMTCTARDAIGRKAYASTKIIVEPADLKPSVSLSADPTWGYAPMDVRYACDVSGGDAPVSTIVDFGDGSSSNVLDDTHRYTEPGYYTMTCTATDVDGDTKTDSISLRVKELVDEQPSVDLDVTPTQGEAPLTVSYACVVEGGDAPVTSSVSVGSSSTSALEGDITFDVPGSYDVVCSATDADGDSDSDSVTVTVREKDVAPLVELTATPPEGYAPLEVEYRCAVSGGNAPIESSLSFGDGERTSDLNGTHTYAAPGTYTMTCQAEDADGDTDVEALSITVLEKGVGPSSIEFSATPDTGIEPFTTRVECEAFGGIAPISYHVELGDTRTLDGADIDEYVGYDSYGVYGLTCTATDALGRSLSADERVIVLPDSPVDITPDSPRDSDDLSCAVTAYADAVFAYDWYRNGELIQQGVTAGSSLDASETSVGDVIECVAELPGYDIEVGRDTETVREDEYTGPTSIDFDVSPNEGTAPLETSWTCDVEGGIEPIDYAVDIDWNSMTQTVASADGAVILLQPANYTFTCTATDANGDSLSAQDFVEVTEANYEDGWSISAEPRSGEVPLYVRFDADTSDISLDGEVRWDFADGHEAFGDSVGHIFARVGTYDVIAYATLEDGTVLEKSVTITVTPAEDEAPGIDMSRVRISHTYAEIIGDTLYATVTVSNDAGTTLDASTASIYLPDLNVYAQTEMPRIRDGSRESVQFFVELDGFAFDPIAVFVIENEDIRLQDATIVVG